MIVQCDVEIKGNVVHDETSLEYIQRMHKQNQDNQRWQTIDRNDARLTQLCIFFHHNARLMAQHTLVYYLVLINSDEESFNTLVSPDPDDLRG